MTAHIRRIAPVLTVSDVKAAIDWYGRALGFKPGYINRAAGDETAAYRRMSKLAAPDDKGYAPAHLWLAKTLMAKESLDVPLDDPLQTVETLRHLLQNRD